MDGDGEHGRGGLGRLIRIIDSFGKGTPGRGEDRSHLPLPNSRETCKNVLRGVRSRGLSKMKLDECMHEVATTMVAAGTVERSAGLLC